MQTQQQPLNPEQPLNQSSEPVQPEVPAVANPTVPTEGLSDEERQQLDVLLQRKYGTTIDEADQFYQTQVSQQVVEQAYTELESTWEVDRNTVISRAQTITEKFGDIIEANPEQLDSVDGMKLMWQLFERAGSATDTVANKAPAQPAKQSLLHNVSPAAAQYKFKQSDINKMSSAEKKRRWPEIVQAYANNKVFSD